MRVVSEVHLNVPDWVFNRIDGAIDRLLGGLGLHDDAPRLPLKADEWELTNTKSDFGMGGWWLIATHTESSVDTQHGQVVFVWARRKPAKELV